MGVLNHLRHRKPELAATPHFTFSHDLAAMGLDNPLGDVQPQAGAGGIVFRLGPVAINTWGS